MVGLLLGSFGSTGQKAHAAAPAHAAKTSLRPTPPDSYLQYKVYSITQLIQQVTDNPTVRQRFARHFQIPESRVVSYMRANLVESYIPKTGRYTVYCVHRSGKFYPIKQTFRQGTKVFALRNGEPVMKWVCGNPLSRFLPAVKISRVPPKVLVAPSIQELTPADTVSVLVPSEVAAPVYQPLVPTSIAAASAPIFSGGGGGSSLLPLLLPVALVGVNAGGGGGGGGSQETPVPGGAVPEAGSLLYVAAALPVGFLLRRRLRSRLH